MQRQIVLVTRTTQQQVAVEVFVEDDESSTEAEERVKAAYNPGWFQDVKVDPDLARFTGYRADSSDDSPADLHLTSSGKLQFHLG
jgi:GrpB-like predicted nucleotidyltransferase (UPF0157 family)